MLPCPTHGPTCDMYWQTVDGPQHLLSVRPYLGQSWADQRLVAELKSVIFDANLYLWSQRDYIRGEKCFKTAKHIIKELESMRQIGYGL